ncbi:N-acetylglucosamine-6-phosphate deacetylase [Parapedobacter sp. SGR-10]|uniref:N-acetylglucosamine-6-phosphate deacetylase n=1 Tax=Parapedobacter sp. SGR-10 TaxID=2710879 RepID=UPI0013D22868|nr:N-acetylglucosamine-6-phosphate deacetylase [Parapedobacter sp. SGR-10]NGF57609.1 N-acetylglucosamine-6-phosphate deacetylase [Parapedobacter sp. SGR-10]
MGMVLKNFAYYNEQDELITQHALYLQDGVIKELSPEISTDETSIDLRGAYLVPAFVDLQVNGGIKVYFSHTITEQVLEQMYIDHLQVGTVNILPTLVTTSLENILKAVEVVKTYISKGKPGVLGLHLEGPFLNIEKKGAHNPKYIRKPTDEELKTILDAGEGVIKMMTVAPEQFTDDQLFLIQDRGIVISAGHSNSTAAFYKTIFDKGVNCITHLYNAMSPFMGREPGLVGATLDSDVYAGIIVDGFHCDDTAVRLAYRLKKGKLFLVSDATFIGEEDLEMDGIQFIHKPGRYVNAEGNLAGSNISMYDAVRHSINKVGIPAYDVFKMAAEIPFQLLGLADKHGKVKTGYFADLVALSKDGLSITHIFRRGEEITKGVS